MAFWWGGGRPGGMEDVCTPPKTQRSRASQLQSQWQQVAERECRAWVRNRELLQDFQRAQDTLRDLAARTATMAAIRVEYEKHLEHRFPQWQRRLEEKRIAAQQKEVALHLKEALRKVTEEGIREAHSRTTKAVNAPLSSPGPALSWPGPSPLPTSPIPPHSLNVPENGETHLHRFQKNNKVTKESSAQNLYAPRNTPVQSPWLAGAPPRPGAPQAGNIQNLPSPSDLRELQDLIRAGYPFQHLLHHLASQPQEQPHRDPILGYPPGWPGLCSVPRLQSPYSQVPWSGYPIADPRDWGMAGLQEPDAKGDSACRGGRERSGRPESPKDSSQSQRGYKRQTKTNNQPYELDIKPVRLPSARGDSSEGGSACSEAPQDDAAGPGKRRRRKKEKRGEMPQSGMNREQSSAGSSVSSLTASGVVKAKDSTPEARSQRSGMPIAIAPSTGEEESQSQSQEEASESAEGEAAGGVNQGSEDGQETEDSSQSDVGRTSEEDDDGEEEVVEKAVAEQEREEGEGEMVEESEGEQDVDEEEEGSGDEGREGSSCSEEAEGMGGVLEQARVEVGKRLKVSAKDAGDPGSERNGLSEEEEETEDEREEGVEDGGGSEKQEEEEEEEEDEEEGEEDADEQEGFSQEENEGDEGEGSSSLEEGETEEGNDAVEEDEEDEEDEEGEGGPGVPEEAEVDKWEEESEGTDSEDEIITSQLEKRSNMPRKANIGMWDKTRAGGNIGDIEEEEEDEGMEQIAEEENNESDDEKKLNDDDEDDSEDGDDIEGLLAPRRDSSNHQVCVAEEKEGAALVSPQDGEPEEKPPSPQRELCLPQETSSGVMGQTITVKSKALWHDSDSELEENVPGGAVVTTTPLKDVLEDVDDFYD